MSSIGSLVHDLVWPIVVLIAIGVFKEPLGKLVETIGKRATGISVATVKIELAQLSKASLPKGVIDNLAGTVVTASGLPMIADAIREASRADYVIVDIGTLEDHKWLTSRTYILAAALELIRRTRCIVFTSGDRYLGTAVLREIQKRLGFVFPHYEMAFAVALGGIAGRNPSSVFKQGLTDNLVNEILNTFVLHPEISLEPPSAQPAGWVVLFEGDQPRKYENAQWVSPGLLYDILWDRIDRGVMIENQSRSEAEATRLVLEQTGTFVAVVDQQRKFKELIDRSRLADQVAREAAGQLG